MIGTLCGELQLKHPPYILLDVNGVGYELQVSMTTFYALPDIGQRTSLFTHLAIRDDAHLLYGFAQLQERDLFRALIKVNGIGAKVALVILSGMDPEQFRQCIKQRDINQFIHLPGIGKKTAERLVVEMYDRLDSIEETTMAVNTMPPSEDTTGNPVNDAVSALIALGYKPQEASKYVHAVVAEGMDSEALIREALKSLVKQ